MFIICRATKILIRSLTEGAPQLLTGKMITDKKGEG